MSDPLSIIFSVQYVYTGIEISADSSLPVDPCCLHTSAAEEYSTGKADIYHAKTRASVTEEKNYRKGNSLAAQRGPCAASCLHVKYLNTGILATTCCDGSV